MQETRYTADEDKAALEQKERRLQEFFAGRDDDDVTNKMDKRLKKLEAEGHELLRRVPIPLNRARRIAKKLSSNGDDSLTRAIAKAMEGQ